MVDTANAAPKLEVSNLTIRYGDKVALKDASFEVREHEIFGIIGPANSGKTSFLRAINRMDEMTSGMHVEGSIAFTRRIDEAAACMYALQNEVLPAQGIPVQGVGRQAYRS